MYSNFCISEAWALCLKMTSLTWDKVYVMAGFMMLPLFVMRRLAAVSNGWKNAIYIIPAQVAALAWLAANFLRKENYGCFDCGVEGNDTTLSCTLVECMVWLFKKKLNTTIMWNNKWIIFNLFFFFGFVRTLCKMNTKSIQVSKKIKQTMYYTINNSVNEYVQYFAIT